MFPVLAAPPLPPLLFHRGENPADEPQQQQQPQPQPPVYEQDPSYGAPDPSYENPDTSYRGESEPGIAPEYPETRDGPEGYKGAFYGPSQSEEVCLKEESMEECRLAGGSAQDGSAYSVQYT